MAEKLIRLIHKMSIQLHLMAERFADLSPAGQAGNFWIQPRIWSYGKRRFIQLLLEAFYMEFMD